MENEFLKKPRRAGVRLGDQLAGAGDHPLRPPRASRDPSCRPLLLVLYAATYVAISHDQPDSLSEALSRTGALYFTVTVFATVGFGDIVPRTDRARIVVMTQMLGGLIALGLVLRILLGAVQVAVRLKTEDGEQPDAVRREGG
jgi:Ion channel